MPGIPWCPLVAPTVDAPQASASDTTHLKLFLGPVGACEIQETQRGGGRLARGGSFVASKAAKRHSSVPAHCTGKSQRLGRPTTSAELL